MNLSIHLYSINSMFYPDFLKFYCSRILARIPDDVLEPHLGLILTTADSQTPLVLMILTALGFVAFSQAGPCLMLPHDPLGWWVWGGRSRALIIRAWSVHSIFKEFFGTEFCFHCVLTVAF